MISVVVIAANFVREQRWTLFFLILWIVGFSTLGVFSGPVSAEDTLMLFKQLAFYAVVFAAFFGSSALRSDLRSRRIFTILAKPISRAQYLLGLIVGTGIILALFCVCTGLSGTWVLGHYGLPASQIWIGIEGAFTASMLVASMTLCLSVFLPALFSALGGSALVGIPIALAWRGQPHIAFLIPVYPLLEPVVELDLSVRSHGIMLVSVLAWVETALFFLAGAWIFARRDIIAGTE